VAGPEVPEGGAGAGSWIRIRPPVASCSLEGDAVSYSLGLLAVGESLPGRRPGASPEPGAVNQLMKLNSVSGWLVLAGGFGRVRWNHPRIERGTRGAVGSFFNAARPLWADGKGLHVCTPAGAAISSW